MGDSRSWAAEMEDEILTCSFGNQRKYFDRCKCQGCLDLNKLVNDANAKADAIHSIVSRYFLELPREKWDSVVSIRIK